MAPCDDDDYDTGHPSTHRAYLHLRRSYYLAEEEGCVTFDLSLAPAVGYLIKSYPAWSNLHHIPVGSNDDDDDNADGGDGGGDDSAATLSLCAMLTELERVGVLESRKVE